MSFDYNMQVEDMAAYEEYVAMEQYYDEMEQALRCAVAQLIGYKQIVNYSAYKAAVEETLEEAEADMIDFLAGFGITTREDFEIYIAGVELGMKIGGSYGGEG